MFYLKMHMNVVCVCTCICVHSLHGQNKEFCSVLFCSVLLLHLFPLLFVVDVSYETPPFIPVLHVLPRQFSLRVRQVVLDVIQPPPLWSPSPFPRHLHPHHCLAYAFVVSSQYMPIPLQPTFLDISHIRCPSNSFIPNSFQHGDSTHNLLISATFTFFFWAFLTAHVSAPYIIACLTTVLYTSP